jgi:cytochrome P450
VQWVTRTTLAPYEIGDTVIPARSRVVLFYAGANRDPRRFTEPDRFDVDRKPVGHTGFGHGSHFCMGAHLARLEVVVALNGLFDRIAGLELAGPVKWTTTPSLSGPTSVPLRAVAG